VFLTSSCAYSRGNLKRKRESSTDQNTWREEGASGLKPKLRIVCSQSPSKPLIPATKDNLPQTKIPGISAAISATLISAIPIQSVAMPAKAPDDVKLTPKPSPVIACRQKLKSIVVYTALLRMNVICQMYKRMHWILKRLPFCMQTVQRISWTSWTMILAPPTAW